MALLHTVKLKALTPLVLLEAPRVMPSMRKTSKRYVLSATRKQSARLFFFLNSPCTNPLFFIQVPWTDMPLDILHSYRHAYKLDTPSAYSTDYSRLLLSRGIGLRSPTSIAARRLNSSGEAREINGNGGFTSAAQRTLTQTGNATSNGISSEAQSADPSELYQNNPSTIDERHALHQVIGQGRVSKKQLAQVVRKHFNNAGLGEQEAISRFLYKVREEGRGREFRLRFQP